MIKVAMICLDHSAATVILDGNLIKMEGLVWVGMFNHVMQTIVLELIKGSK